MKIEQSKPVYDPVSGKWIITIRVTAPKKAKPA